MNIALDFDDTYTADPSLWDSFIVSAIDKGHSIWVVTARRDTIANRELIKLAMGGQFRHVTLIFANLKSKLDHCDSIGLKIHIWIDDSPSAIVFGS